MRKIFISYSNEDSNFAKRLAEALNDTEVASQLHTNNVTTGERWPDLIRDSIRSASAMVVLLSTNTKTNSWIMFEIGAALALGIPVIPVLFSDTSRDQAIPEVLREIKVLDVSELPIAEMAKRLKRNLP